MARHDFTGQVAVVTGAGSGIGRATALALARRGARVHVADLHADRAEQVAAAIAQAGGTATAHTVDVADPAQVEALAERVYAADGAVDVLHNNAGIGHAGPVADTELADWQRIVGVNLMGVVHGVHFFVPRMLGQGRGAHIVNTASLAGLTAVAQMVPYCTTKHAVVGLSESLDAELREHGIRVHAICPGVIDTNIVAETTFRGEAGGSRERAIKLYRRFGTSPDKVADAVIDAVERNLLVRPVPRSHAFPSWHLRRISPALAQPIARRLVRLLAPR